MASELQDTDAHALEWVVRVNDEAFDDWPGFQAWLEASPRHAERYNALSADVAEMAALLPAAARPRIAPPRAAAPRWPLWGGGTIAASLALVVGYAAFEDRARPYAVETAAGTMRTVDLADGSVATLGGGTRMVLDHSDDRVATLERGEAMFEIRHDAGDPFEVTVGGRRLVDVGTAFDVKRAEGETRIGVAEGAVDFQASDGTVRLVAGQGLVARDGQASERVAVDTAAVGAWRRGTLAYESASLAEVAADLSRATGADIRVDPTIAGRSFSGSITTATLVEDPARAGPLLDVAIRRVGDHWVMTARP